MMSQSPDHLHKIVYMGMHYIDLRRHMNLETYASAKANVQSSMHIAICICGLILCVPSFYIIIKSKMQQRSRNSLAGVA